jgi:hypothetical protein
MPSEALAKEGFALRASQGRLHLMAGLGGPIPLRHEKADRPALD